MDYLNIDAFFPYYDMTHNYRTCIVYKNGTKEFTNLNISQYILRLYFMAQLNKESIYHWSSQILNATSNLPLLLTNKLIFIPVKFKPYPYTPGHSFTFGYINYESIAFYSSEKIILENQTVLSTISPHRFIEKKVRDATLLAYAYRDQQQCLRK